MAMQRDKIKKWNVTWSHFTNLISSAHLLLSSIQRLLDPFREESGSSLEVRAHLILCHLRLCLSDDTPPCAQSTSRVLPERVAAQLTSTQGGGGGVNSTHVKTHTHMQTGGTQDRPHMSAVLDSVINFISRREFTGLVQTCQSSYIELVLRVLICWGENICLHCWESSRRSHLPSRKAIPQLTWKWCA